MRFDSMSDYLREVVVRTEDELTPDLEDGDERRGHCGSCRARPVALARFGALSPTTPPAATGG
jgi:hypothetical protein